METHYNDVDTTSPGFIGREWIETYWTKYTDTFRPLLPALLVGSGLKQK